MDAVSPVTQERRRGAGSQLGPTSTIEETLDVTTALATKLIAITDATHLTRDEIGSIVAASSRSVSRWINGDVEPQRTPRRRLLDLADVAEELRNVMRSEDANL